MSFNILELIALANDPAVTTSNLLRCALVVAQRLQKIDSATWLEHELSGYPTFDSLPGYRQLRGSLHVIHSSNGCSPLQLECTASIHVVRLAEQVLNCPLNHPLREIETWVTTGEFVRASKAQPSEEVMLFQREFQTDLEPVIVLTRCQLSGCLDTIRMHVLQWALESTGTSGEEYDNQRPRTAVCSTAG
ncbi:hypothetical protein ABKY47_004554 [Aeromonas hydrophila]